ncbi:MAG: N-acetylmuramoyl-L-alanine amidase [Paludibacteraceae bacterium]
MKKFFIITLCLLGAFNISAASRFYLNPGHGGHDSDDRPTPLPLGVVIFYESDGNLDRGLSLRSILQGMGHTVGMSRTTNYSSDDLALSTIAANSNSYGGYFNSIHTNGANASANYTCTFYKGTQSSPSYEAVSPSKNMATQCANWHDNNRLTDVTYSTPRAFNDYAFNGWNYGVLRTNNRPGYLVESWFHDYRPEALRLKSTVYNKYLAWQMARAYKASPGIDGTLKGCIIGDIRDVTKGCGYTNYTTRNRDSKLALNGVKVVLKNSGGTQVATMTTDNCANGVYGFFDVTAGTYTVEISKSGYKTQTATVTVVNSQSTLKKFDMVEGSNTGITASTYSVNMGTVTVGSSSTKTVTVTGTGLTSNITVTSSHNMYTVTPTSLPTSGGTLTIKYTPTSAGTHNSSIVCTSGSHSITITATGTAVNPPLTFTQVWNYSEKSTDGTPAWASDKTKIRNMDFGGGKLYVVNPSDGIIQVINAQTGEKLKDLNMTGVDGGVLKVMDCLCSGDKILACNLATPANGPLKVYIWDNDNAQPRVFLSTTSFGGMDRIGDNFTLEGSADNGKLYFAGGGVSTENKVLMYTITNGVCATTPTVKDLKKDDGTGIVLGLSPRVRASGTGKYWGIGQNYYPTLFSEDGIATTTLKPEALNSDNAGNEFKAFSFKGTQYAFATAYDPNATPAERLRNGRAILVDATDGWADAAKIGEYPSGGMGTTRNTSFSTSVAVAVNGTAGVEMWVLIHNQGIAYFKHGVVPTYNVNPTPTIDVASSLSFEAVINNSQVRPLSVSASNLTADISLALSGTNANLFTLSTNTIPKAGGSVNITYKPTTIGNHTATLTLTSTGATTKTVTLTGTGKQEMTLDDNVNLTQVWNFSQISGNTANWITNGSQVTQDIAYNNGKLYVLERNSDNVGRIHIVNAYTGVKTGELNTAACTEGTYSLSAIDVLGGKVVACNLAAGGTSNLIVYKWDSDTSEPVKMLETTTHADVRAGDKMGVSGTMTSGKIWFGFDSKVYNFTVTNGVAATTPTVINLMKSGTAFATGQSAAVGIEVNSDGSFWVIGKDAYPARFSSTGEWIENFATAAVGGPVHGTAANFFDFGTKKYAAVATYLNKSQSSLGEGCFSLINVTSGIAAEQPVGLYPANGLGGTRNTSFRSQICSAIENDVVHIWVHMPIQGCAYFKYDGKTPVVGCKTVENSSMLLYNTHETLFVKGIEAANIDLYTLTGQKIRTVANQNEMSISGLQGIYVVVVKDNANNIKTGKIIIK